MTARTGKALKNKLTRQAKVYLGRDNFLHQSLERIEELEGALSDLITACEHPECVNVSQWSIDDAQTTLNK